MNIWFHRMRLFVFISDQSINSRVPFIWYIRLKTKMGGILVIFFCVVLKRSVSLWYCCMLMLTFAWSFGQIQEKLNETCRFSYLINYSIGSSTIFAIGISNKGHATNSKTKNYQPKQLDTEKCRRLLWI